MFKVVIIDDEPMIVEGLSKIINWGEFECCLAGTAQDGKEGLELIKEVRPDIVFSDIDMPETDGLEMLNEMRLECPDTMIAIMTGYRDFALAQEAIRLGVCRLITKPSNLLEIEETVRYMTKILKKKKKYKVEETQDSSGSFIVNNALSYIEENYTGRLTLATLAEKMYVSQWHLSKLLNKHTGKSFCELLNEVRVREAKNYLVNPAFRIYDVSEIVGFADAAHFSRVFKKYARMSPNEYRNKEL